MTDSAVCNQLIVPASPTKLSGKKREFLVIKISENLFDDSDESHDEEWFQILKSIKTAACVEHQIRAIKKVSNYLLKVDREPQSTINLSYVNLAADFFLTAPFKHPCKCALTKTFNSVNLHVKSSCVSCLKEGLNRRIQAAKASAHLGDITIASNALLSCYENFQLGVEVLDSIYLNILDYLDQSLQLCHSFLSAENTPMQKFEVSIAVHTISRIIITAFQRMKEEDFNKFGDNGKVFIRSILKNALCVVGSSEVPLDTRTNFGFVIVLSFERLEGFGGWTRLLETEKNFRHDDLSLLCICSGLLSSLKSDQLQLMHPVNQKPIVACVLDRVLLINDRSIQESNTILALWRVVQQLTRVLVSHPNLVSCFEITQIEGLLDHVWGLLDHYMDTVKHLASTILENIMLLKNVFQSSGIDLVEKMTKAVLLISETKRSRYVILSTLTSHVSTPEIINRIPNVINSLITAMLFPSMSSHVSSAFVTMANAEFKRLPYKKWCNVWVMPLFHTMQNCSFAETPALEEALSKIIKICPGILNEVLPDFDKKESLSVSKLRVLLICMKISRRLGVVSPEDHKSSMLLGILPVNVLESALCNQCDEIRLSALSLIVETNRSTESLIPTDFMFLKLFLSYNINCEVPSFRQQTLSCMTKLFSRMKDSAHTLTRLMKQKKFVEDGTAQCIKSYLTFLQWLLAFCFNNLGVGSNHSRILCSLKVLTVMFDVFEDDPLILCDEFQSQLWSEKNALTLLGVILVDSFEENKAMATKILARFPLNTLDLNENVKLFKLFRSGCSLASSNHPCDCVSAAFLLELCCNFYSKCPKLDHVSEQHHSLDVFGAVSFLTTQLKEEAHTAEVNILQAASSRPMYGTLFCIRHLLHLVPDFSGVKGNSAWKNMITDLIELSFDINRIVSPIVNSSSPEGHIPMDFNQDSSFLTLNVNHQSKVTAQMVLLCSWRTVKEVSLLLGKLSDCCPIAPDSNGLISEEQIIAIGVHLTTLLEETKHRGAFEQAYVGFNLLASRLWRHSNRSLQELPLKWLNELMVAIKTIEPVGNKLCATRRSAGVPFLVQALVSAELQTGASLLSLQVTMSQLLECASDKNKYVECRTHALNILRALYRHAPLAEHIAPYISEGVIVALSGFRGKTWAERNSATLLFSSLMTRIFGVRRSREELSPRNKMTGRVFFHRYPDLYEFLLQELKRSVKALTSGDMTELAVLHPILLLIARLYPSSLEGTDTPMQLSTFVSLVQKCASNSVLKTRVLAAKAVVPLVTANVFVKHLDDLFRQLMYTPSCNYIHGLALQIVHLLMNSSILSEAQSSALICNLDRWTSTTLDHLKMCNCKPVQEVFLQILEVIVGAWHALLSPLTLKKIKEVICKSILVPAKENKGGSYEVLGQSIFEVRATRILLKLLIFQEDRDSNALFLNLLRHPHYEIVHETLATLEKILQDERNSTWVRTTEEIVPNLGEGAYWLEQVPLKAAREFCFGVMDNTKIAKALIALVMTDDDFQRRMALPILSFLSPSMWWPEVDIKQLLQWCCSPHERTSCAALACFSSLLKHMADTNEVIPQTCRDGCKLLKSFCSADKGITSRMGAVNFLTQHRQLLKQQNVFLPDDTVSELWECAILLACDDSSEVRSCAASLCQSELPLVSQRSLEYLVDEFITEMDSSSVYSLATATALALGPLPDTSDFDTDEERVFDKGETNMFIEYDQLTNLLCQHISSLLSGGARLSSYHWKWIWTTISGISGEDISSAEMLFSSIRQQNRRVFSVSESNILRPPQVVNSLYRLSKVEDAYYGSSKSKHFDSFPFNSERLFGMLPKYLQLCTPLI